MLKCFDIPTIHFLFSLIRFKLQKSILPMEKGKTMVKTWKTYLGLKASYSFLSFLQYKKVMDRFGITAQQQAVNDIKWNSPADYTAVLFAMTRRHLGAQYSYCGQKNSHAMQDFKSVCETALNVQCILYFPLRILSFKYPVSRLKPMKK